jgi:aminopeptidase N
MQDYKPPPYVIDTVNLSFLLEEGTTRVESRLRVQPNHSAATSPPLFLNGREGAHQPASCCL